MDRVITLAALIKQIKSKKQENDSAVSRALEIISERLSALEGGDGELAAMRACAIGANALETESLKGRIRELEKKHPPLTYEQFRNLLLIFWAGVLLVLGMVMYG